MSRIKPPSPQKIWRFSSAQFLEESNFRNKQSMVQYPRSYQRDKRIIEKEQNINRKYVIIRICQQLYFSDTLFS